MQIIRYFRITVVCQVKPSLLEVCSFLLSKCCIGSERMSGGASRVLHFASGLPKMPCFGNSFYLGRVSIALFSFFCCPPFWTFQQFSIFAIRCFYDYVVYVSGPEAGVPGRKGRISVIIYQCQPHNDSPCSPLLMRIITLARTDWSIKDGGKWFIIAHGKGLWRPRDASHREQTSIQRLFHVVST